ncbi:hypothetical protein B0F90DRAFT_1374667 [Multifurca ochricompacta]|uniref:AN1-type domain-containing protein n=1 Tax=Multifurca ochricompacta TaxID=376703 RepID=A0AAD4M7F3_9AGAM|nr:hypothetical protein B0F90DRAFT_1374667 [Multifurca ochricompacta]
MDLAPIGAHCSLPSCHKLDLLPILCHCDQQFCKDHIFPDTHHCPVDPSKALRDASPALQTLQRCAFASCNKPSLDAFVGDSAGNEGRTSALCQRCNLGYCASHRDASQHTCPVSEPISAPKNEVAHALLVKHFPSAVATSSNGSASTPTRKVPNDPKKLAQLQKVELMKMRHRALPADPKDKPGSIGVDQRLHVKVSWEGDREAAAEKVFWFRKTVSTGKAIDLLSRHFNVRTTAVCL